MDKVDNTKGSGLLGSSAQPTQFELVSETIFEMKNISHLMA